MLRRAHALLRYGRSYSSAPPRKHDPLNILFCGSDAFSIHSLRSLYKLKSSLPDKVAGIEVVCRPDKRVGRGLKHIREVPIKAAAKDLDLKLHQIDTFTGWTPPSSINLIVAVSFGLLVPSRILTAAKYGGLNVHPSMLPDLRGPAPVVHTLLKRRTHTGVTLQTMHPTQFDRGEILAQTPSPGIEVREDSTPDQLLEFLGAAGAEILQRGIEDSLFVPPMQTIDAHPTSGDVAYAPKIKPNDRRIDWTAWDVGEIVLRGEVLGKLWDMRTFRGSGRSVQDVPEGQGGEFKRVIFEGPWRIYGSGGFGDADLPPGASVQHPDTDGRIGFITCSGAVIAPASVTIEGEKKRVDSKGLQAMYTYLR